MTENMKYDGLATELPSYVTVIPGAYTIDVDTEGLIYKSPLNAPDIYSWRQR